MSAEDARWLIRNSTGEMGPMTTEAFMAAVKNGGVGPETLVRLTDNPEWMAASQIEGLEFSAERVGNARGKSIAKNRTLHSRRMQELFAECIDRQNAHLPKPKPVPVVVEKTQRISIGPIFGSLFEAITSRVSSTTSQTATILATVIVTLLRSWIFWVSVAVVLVAVIYPQVAPYLVTQQQVCSGIEETLAEFEKLRSANTDDATWDGFQQRSLEKLQSYLPQLKRNAKIDDQASMALLWMARDYVPMMIKERSKTPTEAERKVKTFLDTAKNGFKKTKPLFSWSRDPTTVTIVALDVIAACAVIGFLGRNWFSRVLRRS